MTDLAIEETSGVDHPAHLREGWLVMKSADVNGLDTTLDRILKTKESRMTPEEMREELDKANARIMELEDDLGKYKKAEDEDDHAEKAEDDEEHAAKGYGSKDDEAMKAEDEDEYEKAEDEDELEELFMKSAPAPVARAFAKAKQAAQFAMEKAAAAEAELAAQREAAADAKAIEKARGWNHLSLDAEQVGPLLRRLSDANPDLAKSVTGLLDSINGQAESANIFAEIGKSASTVPMSGDAVGRLTSMAKSLVDAGKAATIEQGIAEVAISNPDLYTQYLTEKGA